MMITLDTSPSEQHHATTRPRLTLLVMCLAAFMIQLDVTIVNVALPRIQSGLALDSGTSLWVVTAYALSLAACIPVAGALGDRFGHKPVFVGGIGVFVAGSVACATATSGVGLVVARAVQGAGGAAMLALTLSIVADAFPHGARARVIGTWAAVGGTGFGAGPVAGGVILTVTGWSAVFWVNVPIGVLTLAGALITVPASRRRRHTFDGVGATLCAAGLLAVTYGLTASDRHSWLAPSVAGPVLLGVGLLVAFACWERLIDNPMAPPDLLRVPGFAAAAAIYLIAYAAFGGILYFTTLLYQNVAGWSVLQTGLSWLFMNAPFLTLAQLSGRLQHWAGARTLTVGGCLIAATGAGILSLVDVGTPFAVTAAAFVLAGAGFGVLVPVLTHAAMAHIPSEHSGIASGLLNTARQVGTSVGLALLGYVAASRTLAAWRDRVVLAAPAGGHRSIEVARQVSTVVNGRVTSVGRTLGPAYRDLAARSFVAGYHWAVGLGALCLGLGALIAWAALPRDTRRSS